MTGVLILDKPAGFTSFDAVAKTRRLCGEKKCGHTGTLDPMATGVMTVLLGGATRFASLLPDHDKAYIASFRLGLTTDTLDVTGTTLATRPVTATRADVAAALAAFRGKITQIPPMYSAVSVGGQRLYQLARQGVEVERPARSVTIHALTLTEADEAANTYTIAVDCSAGTYIRTLVGDLGERLGCGAVLTALRRTRANGFDESQAVTLDRLAEASARGVAASLLIPLDLALGAYPALTVTAAQAARFRNGGALFTARLHGLEGLGLYRVYGPDGAFLGLGEADGGESLAVKRVFQTTE
ncbi:MAG: tRNA pseudouridine(55) synthase TruB [Clostridia bacterium]|nr:tRNA pseudouridine(55) synthase TruB [Clostridia bacterium]